MSQRSKFPSYAIWLLGVAATAAALIAPMIWDINSDIKSDFIIGTVGLILTLVCETRLKVEEAEKSTVDSISELRSIAFDTKVQTKRLAQIETNTESDAFFHKRYEELQWEIDGLSEGTYQVKSLAAVYQDDIRSIQLLQNGEKLLSTCPITHESVDAALKYISDPHYLATIGAHCEAAKRRVSVTRIYYFKNREFFDSSKMREHLSALKNAGIDIQVTFLSEVTLEPDYDFLVFGARKVSVGVIDPATGKVWSARASIIPRDVNAYIEKYQRLKELSKPIDKVN
jgi:hypothetical protein